ncbi:facilitated trehalose transporter Tret1 [Rhipicephalus sanguineus]|nr:facilitated trehalose transporter Tret1 [Rhipicephalus sanguineus]
MASLSFGFSVAYSSPALPSIRKSMEFSATESDWFGSLVMLGAVLGGLGGGRQLNAIGRRGTLIASSLWFMVGWMCLVVATPKAALFVGRLLTGVGTGIVALTVSVFISEISPANLRGQLNTGANLILCGGILAVFVLGKFLSFWLLAACCLTPAAAMSIALFWCHESPRWLLKNNQRRSAAAALRFYFGPGAATELATLETALSRMHGIASFSLRDLTSRRVYRSFLCVLLIMSMQQLSAIAAIITFTQDIFEDAGTAVSPEDSAIILAFIQMVMVGVATVLADRVGRKILLMFSTILSSVCLGALGLSFSLKASVGDSFKEDYGWLPLTSLGLYFVGYSVGLGPLPWVLLGEMIPLKARAFATGTCTAILFAEGFIVTLSYNGMRAILGVAGTFGFYGASLAVCFVLLVVFVPETGGKNLEGIEQLFGGTSSSPHESLMKNKDQNVG